MFLLYSLLLQICIAHQAISSGKLKIMIERKKIIDMNIWGNVYL